MLVNAGVIRVVHQGDFIDEFALRILEEAGIEVTEIRV